MFKLKAPYTPKGDQVEAIKKLVSNFENDINKQVLLGATGTGKTFTISNIINKIQKKTLESEDFKYLLETKVKKTNGILKSSNQ